MNNRASKTKTGIKTSKFKDQDQYLKFNYLALLVSASKGPTFKQIGNQTRYYSGCMIDHSYDHTST